MAYVPNAACTEIYMVTRRDTAKYGNLRENPWVSLLIDNRDESAPENRSRIRALTLFGEFRKLGDPANPAAIRSDLLRKHPHMAEFVQHPEAELFCVRVNSCLLLDGFADSHFETVDPN
jgi:nitroimidazol reductase NimA-like FMN-containing flavoprotein (pyridoxamine 5'-phosphate oxidase superfamily)